MWISKITLPVLEDCQGLRDVLVRAIKDLGDGTETYTLPEFAAIDAEWTGYRKGVGKNAPELDIPEDEKYKCLMAEVESPVTILYFHGGGYFLMSQASHRKTTSHLAELTKGRCLSVGYRLAPQHPFPAQLLDALMAYFFLLSPPSGSRHEPVPASNIVLAGDSAGGNLALVLLQTMLTMQRMGVSTISFHGREVPVQLPAGVAVNSPWCDISRSMPSHFENEKYDYLKAPVAPGQPDEVLSDQIWPTQPPRVQLYCHATMLTHPLVSPLVATAELWQGCPPVFLCCGNEVLEDEITVTARRIHQGGASVVFQGYEGMPHCFALLFMASPAGSECFQSWAGFCTESVTGGVERKPTGRWTRAFSKALTHYNVPFDEISQLSDHDVGIMMQETKNAALGKEKELVDKWERGESKPRL